MRIAVLTGAGISAESGINTFRDSDGLWEGHDVMEVASPGGFARNPELVLDFYNQRRRQLHQVQPNAAHFALAHLEADHQVNIITQNVDDLHERAGSTAVMHLHGELLKARSTFDENLVMDWITDLNRGDFCEHNHQLRPHIVWFGEAVPLIEPAADLVAMADVLMIIGTSMQVYPAAGLAQMAPLHSPIYFIDPKPAMEGNDRITVLAEAASSGVPKAIELIERQYG